MSIGGSGHSVCLRPASSSSRVSVLLSFPNQRRGCHLTPCIFPGSENGTAPNPGGDQLSDPGFTLSSLSPYIHSIRNPTGSASWLDPDSGRLSLPRPAPGPSSSPPPCCHLPEGPSQNFHQLTAASHSPPRPPPPSLPLASCRLPSGHRDFRMHLLKHTKLSPARPCLCPCCSSLWDTVLLDLSVTCSPPHSGLCSHEGPPSSPAAAAPPPCSVPDSDSFFW